GGGGAVYGERRPARCGGENDPGPDGQVEGGRPAPAAGRTPGDRPASGVSAVRAVAGRERGGCRGAGGSCRRAPRPRPRRRRGGRGQPPVGGRLVEPVTR